MLEIEFTNGDIEYLDCDSDVSWALRKMFYDGCDDLIAITSEGMIQLKAEEIQDISEVEDELD